MTASSILLFLTTTISLIHGMEMKDMSPKSVFIQKVTEQIEEKNTLVCVGLDPDWEKMPNNTTDLTLIDLISKESCVFSFLKKVIKLTAKHCCCYILQEACYINYPILMIATIEYIKKTYPTIPIIVDCQTSGTKKTMQLYIDYYFNKLEADAITVVPYMGQDVVQPFIDDPFKTGIVVIQSDNASSEEVQKLATATVEGKYIALWKVLLDHVVCWNTNKNLMAVISGNLKKHHYSWIREEIGEDFFVLVPESGVDELQPNHFLPHLMNSQKSGVIVHASDKILYPYKPTDTDWEPKIKSAVVDLKNKLNAVRKSSH